MSRWPLVGAMAALLGCGGGGPPPNTCLTDQQVSQFKAGTSTSIDVRNALGPPQMSENAAGGGQQWTYVCMQDGAATEVVQFSFNDQGVLQGTTIQR